MEARFDRRRWSDTRKRIDAMKAGEGTRFLLTEKGAVSTAITRTQDAYSDRRYVQQSQGEDIIVRRIR